MKTFQEFILEALLIENDQEEYAKIRKKIKEIQSRGKPGDEEEALSLSIQAQKLARQIRLAAEGGAALQQMRDTPRTPSNPNSITGGGYAQTGRRGRIGPDSASSVGTVSNSRRRRVFDMNTERDLGPADPSDVRIKNKYTDNTYGGRGTGDSRSGGKIGR
jgi:hypothetical protein